MGEALSSVVKISGTAILIFKYGKTGAHPDLPVGIPVMRPFQTTLGPIVTQLSVRHVKPNLVALTPGIVIALDLGSVDEQLGAIAVVDPGRHPAASLQIVIKRLGEILA